MDDFIISQYGQAKLKQWIEEQNKIAIKVQRMTIKNPSSFHQICWDNGEPYAGAIGGLITYSFIPNDVGCVVKAVHNVTKNEVDLTDYDNW